MSNSRPLGRLQFEVMQVLWELGTATSSDIHRALVGERDIAPTTVATVLSRLEKGGWVTHDVEGRQFFYRAKTQREEIQRSAVRDLATRVFRGDPGALLNCLLRESEVDAKELDEISEIVEAAKRRNAK